MNCLIIVGPSSTGRRESEVEIRIRTYSDSITSVHRGAGRIEDYSNHLGLLIRTGSTQKKTNVFTNYHLIFFIFVP